MHNRSVKKDHYTPLTPTLLNDNHPALVNKQELVLNGAFAVFLTTTAQDILTDLLQTRQLNNELIYCANQLLRAGILCSYFDSSLYRVAATPFLKHYFYQFLKDDRQFEATETDPTADMIATVAATASLLGYDICYNTLYAGIPVSEASLTSCTTMAGNLTTQLVTHSTYQWIKNSLFGSNQSQTKEKCDSPNSRAWLSLDW